MDTGVSHGRKTNGTYLTNTRIYSVSRGDTLFSQQNLLVRILNERSDNSGFKGPEWTQTKSKSCPVLSNEKIVRGSTTTTTLRTGWETHLSGSNIERVDEFLLRIKEKKVAAI